MLRKESIIPRGTLVARQAIFDAISTHEMQARNSMPRDSESILFIWN